MLAEVAHDDDGDGTTEQYIGLCEGPHPLQMEYQGIIMDGSVSGSEHLSYPLFKFDPSVDTWYIAPSHGG